MRAAPVIASTVAVAVAAWVSLQPAVAVDAAPVVASDVRALLQKFVDTVETLPGYQVVMQKQQRIGSDLKPAETLLLKQQKTPDCRYMKWIADPHKGRELILCSGRYDGKIQVHESGLLGIATLSLDPAGSTANSGNLRPIAQAGIYNMAKMLKANIDKRRASAEPEAAPVASERVVEGQTSLCLRSDTMGSDDKAPYPVGAAELCFDKTLAMPTEVQFWHKDGRLMEHYRFHDWNLKPGLTDADFDTKNRAYGF
ncbi:MAG: hypothetical protein JWQ90_1747 [Hydrocarboniphaga sp.]|uniref:DUF1571 domain-containing protein n=1 Tax=Hydrocarboniphaga sp. TaxID=2033016 RepID=UPI002629584A|nr:DUF1571 domain-containing protein [Hydrocarboniphaga sp.]MDB5969297.1 hypothetical protein [Hydrocarboniphaga sp.]